MKERMCEVCGFVRPCFGEDTTPVFWICVSCKAEDQKVSNHLNDLCYRKGRHSSPAPSHVRHGSYTGPEDDDPYDGTGEYGAECDPKRFGE